MRNHRSAVLHHGLFVSGILGAFALSAMAQGPASDPPDTIGTRGFSADGQYSLSQIESVDAITGNVNLNIPLAHLPPGPGGFSAGLNLVYNSSINDISTTQPTGSPFQYFYQASSHGGGWNYGYRYTLWAQSRFPNPLTACSGVSTAEKQAWFKNFIMTPDGNNHILNLVSTNPSSSPITDADDAYTEYDFSGNVNPANPSGACNLGLTAYHGILVFATGDSTYIRVEANTATSTWIAYLPDGTQVNGQIMTGLIGGTSISYAIDSDSTQITDRNLNAVGLVSTCSDGAPCVTYIEAESSTITLSFGSTTAVTCGDGTWTDSIYSSGFANAGLMAVVNWCSYSPSENYLYAVNAAGVAIPADTTYLAFSASDVWSIQLPVAGMAGVGTVFTFGYDPIYPINGWGELHSMMMCSNTAASCPQPQWSVAYTYQFDTTAGTSFTRPPATAINPISSKILSYQEIRDGGPTTQINETTSYYMLFPASAFTYPTVGTVGEIVYPNGSITEILTANPCPVTLKSRDFCPALPYQVLNPDGSVTRMGWASNTAPSTIPTGGVFNPYPQYTAYLTPAGVGAPAQFVSTAQEQNGNVTALNEYGWVSASSVSYSSSDFVTGLSCLPSCPAARTTFSTYYEQTGGALPYWQHGAPAYLRAKQSLTVGSTTCSAAASCVQYSYDNPLTTANVTQMQQWDNTQSAYITSSWTYLYNGNVSTSKDPNGVTTNVVYDAHSMYPTQVVVAQGLPEQRTFNYTYDAYTGLKAVETDADNSISTTYLYDDVERQTSATQQKSGGLSRTTSTTYNDATLAVTTTSDDLPSQSLTTTNYFDPLGRVRLTVDGVGNRAQKAYRYGSASSLVSYELESNPYITTGDTTMGWSLTTRDALGRPTSIQYYGPGGGSPPAPWGSNTTQTGTVSTAYNQTTGVNGCANPATTVTDEASNKHIYCPDVLGREAAVTEPNSTVTNYSYDLLNNLIGVSSAGQSNSACPSGQVRCFSYSSLSRLVTANNPESGATTYKYDNNGNATKRTDAVGTVTNLGPYDGLNRLTAASYSAAGTTAATPSVAYVYDACAFKGALCSITNTASASSYTYDSFGRIVTSTQTTGGTAYQFTYGYSLTDQLTSLQYPSGRLVNYQLDLADRVAAVQNVTAGGNYATISYTAPGGVSTMSMGNGVSHQLTWNDRSQPVGLQATSSSSGSLLTLGLFPCAGGATSCSTGNVGNLQQQTIAAPGLGTLTQTYSYDSVNRLTGASENSGAWAQSYCHDNFGNRWLLDGVGTPPLSVTPETPQGTSCASGPYNTSKNQISSWSYDNAGNVLNIPMGGSSNRSFVYDAENRQVSAAINGATATYSYDGNGLRVSKTSGGVTTIYVYDASGNLAAEYAGQGLVSPCGTATCYITTDHLGSTRMLTDSSGSNNSNLRRYDYLPFGQELPASLDGRTTGMGYTAAPDATNPKFAGEERDLETTLDWLAVRAMSGAQGRFQSVDPGNAGADPSNPQTWNAYAYVGNNPLSYTDPSGESWWTTLIGVGLDIAGFFTGGTTTVLGTILTTGGTVLAGGGTIGGVIGGGGGSPGIGNLGGSGDIWNEHPPWGATPMNPLGLPGIGGAGGTGGGGSNPWGGQWPSDGFFPGMVPVAAGAAGVGEVVLGAGLGTLCIGSGVCEIAGIVGGVGALGAGAYLIYKNTTGGGKTGQKVNADRAGSAQAEIATIRAELAGPNGDPKPNKTPEDKERIDRLKKALKRAIDRMKKSETHARLGQ